MSSHNGRVGTYPRFTKLGLTHKALLDSFAARYGHYSDFNFTSLFSWDTDGSAAIALLDDNLVIRLPDYLTGEPCLSLLGDTRVDDAVAALLRDTDILKLVPEVVVGSLARPEAFVVTEDPDNHDYLYRLEDLLGLRGRQYKKIRNKLHRCNRDFATEDCMDVSVAQAVDVGRLPAYRELLERWTEENGSSWEESALEMAAITRLLEHSEALDLVIVEFAQRNQLVAFSISEMLGEGWAICHFQKALRIHKYFSAFITVNEAEILQELGCSWINWEQDLGIDGLRTSKSVYAPADMLRKYEVSRMAAPGFPRPAQTLALHDAPSSDAKPQESGTRT